MTDNTFAPKARTARYSPFSLFLHIGKTRVRWVFDAGCKASQPKVGAGDKVGG